MSENINRQPAYDPTASIAKPSVSVISFDRQTIIEGLLTTLFSTAITVVAIREGKLKMSPVDLLVFPLALLGPFIQAEWNAYGFWVTDSPWQSSLVIAGADVLVGQSGLLAVDSGPFYFRFANVAFSHALSRFIGKKVFETEHVVFSRHWYS